MVFCDELVQQELDDTTAYIDIPQEIRDFYKMYRPSPLVRAYCLEKKLDTPAKIYYKFEGNNTSGSHKLNTAIAQAYYAKKQGLKGVTTETGAGQWGTALSMACAYLDLDCKVYMVKVSYEQKPFRREVIAHVRRQCDAIPVHDHRSRKTDSGSSSGHHRKPGLCYFRGGRGSDDQRRLPLRAGQRIKSGASASVHYRSGVEDCHGQIRDQAGYDHRLRRRRPPTLDRVLFMGEKLRGEADYEFIAVEPASCPSFTRGRYLYDFCDTGMICPLAKMYTLGSGFIPSANHAGGLRFHGMSSNPVRTVRPGTDERTRGRADRSFRRRRRICPRGRHPSCAGEQPRHQSCQH